MQINTSLWQQELLLAPTADAVLETVRDYLVLCRPDELASLPEACRLVAFETPADVSGFAAALLEHQAEGRRTGPREALTAFFAVAARRLAELSVPHEAGVEHLAPVHALTRSA